MVILEGKLDHITKEIQYLEYGGETAEIKEKLSVAVKIFLLELSVLSLW